MPIPSYKRLCQMITGTSFEYAATFCVNVGDLVSIEFYVSRIYCLSNTWSNYCLTEESVGQTKRRALRPKATLRMPDSPHHDHQHRYFLQMALLEQDAPLSGRWRCQIINLHRRHWLNCSSCRRFCRIMGRYSQMILRFRCTKCTENKSWTLSGNQD